MDRRKENEHHKAALLRRDKTTPCEDMWHTLKLGLPLALLLFLILPFIFR